MNKTYLGLAAMDFDGTLYSHRTGFSGGNRKTLINLGEKSICRAVVTGRNLASFTKVTADLNLPIDYLVFSSGAAVMRWDNGNILKKSALSSEDVDRITNILIDGKFDFMIQDEIPENHRFYYHRSTGENPDFEARIEIYRESAAPLKLKSGPEGASQLVVILPPGEPIPPDFPITFKEYSLIRATSPIDHSSTWLEIFPGDVHKGTGAAWLQKHLGLTEKPSMAVGNDYNDLDMQEWTDSAWVVNNAPEDLKKEYRVTASCEEDGVSLAVSRWLESIR